MQARRVDQDELRVGPVHHAENPVPRGLRLGRYDGDLAADQRVDQGGFAHVRAPDDGDHACAEGGAAHGDLRISPGKRSRSLRAADCSALRRLPPLPIARRPNVGTSQLTVNDCAGGSPGSGRQRIDRQRQPAGLQGLLQPGFRVLERFRARQVSEARADDAGNRGGGRVEPGIQKYRPHQGLQGIRQCRSAAKAAGFHFTRAEAQVLSQIQIARELRQRLPVHQSRPQPRQRPFVGSGMGIV